MNKEPEPLEPEKQLPADYKGTRRWDTNRPNLTEEEKEHYNKVAMDLINKDIDLELSVSVLTKTLKDVQLERDALWVKTQEDERIINDLNDAVKEKKRQRDEAIELVKDLMPFAKLDLDFDRFGVITDIQARFEDLMLEVS